MRFVRNIKLYFMAAAVLVLLSLGGMSYIIHGNHAELSKIKEYQAQEAQFLMSVPSFETERQRLTLYIRDIILAEWKRIKYPAGSYDRAYEVANCIVGEAVKYPYIPASEMSVLMAAVLKQESSYRDSLVSSSGARGMSQFLRSTGRVMLKVIGIEYSPEVFYDFKVTIRIQAVLFDILHASYDGRKDLILADYKGGPPQAEYWRTNKALADTATRAYVPEVLETYNKYLDGLKTYKAVLDNKMEIRR